MPKQIFGAESVVTTLNRAFNDISPSNATFNNQVAAAGTTTDSQMAFAKQYGAGFAGQTADALSTLILGNLGVLPNAALQTALKDYITAAGVANIGIIALQLGDILSGLENATGDQAGFKAAAVAWNNEVTAAYNYSSNPANVTPSDAGPVTTPGTTFTLTAGADSLSPTSAEAAKKTTSGNDTFRGDVAANVLETIDSIDGGAGTDTLNALLNASTAKPVLSNIEILNLTTVTAASTLELGDASGLQQVWFKGTATSVDLTVNDVALTSTVGLTGTYNATTDATFVFKGATGTNDTATVAVQEAAFTAGDKVTIAAIENLNLVVSDLASTAGTNVSTIGALVVANTKNIVATGTVGTLTIGNHADANFTALKTFDASGLKGNLVLDLATGTDPTTGVTILASSGGTNTITMSATAGQTDVIKFVAGNVSTVNKLTTVTGFDFAADKLDVAAFALGADTTVGSTAVNVAGDIAGFFSGTARVVLNDTTDTVYVDVNKDGNFNAGTDLALVLTGATAATFTAADLTLA
ncbi:hypothetical protein [Acidovorax sp.]|uniref:hypothetical protein n=1 Tax=Acidovorax sp. TaxID=1872122 RepID=UPI002ACD4BFB|nr:hypothetical protein [Acidovorax sp.]MDZ7865181.1 hypothetical protein [Acidovorax sp.]